MKIKRILQLLGSPALVSGALLWLIVLLIAGTIAQKYQGLYAAQQTYFASYFFLAGGLVPLPGAKTVILVICVGIIAKLSQPYVWRWRWSGSNLVHLGVLLLLAAPLLAGQNKLEGALVLEQGRDKNYTEDYYRVELVLQQVDSRETNGGDEASQSGDSDSGAASESDAVGEPGDGSAASDGSAVNEFNTMPSVDSGDEVLNSAQARETQEIVIPQQQLLRSMRQQEQLAPPGLPFSIVVEDFYSNIDLVRVSSQDEQASADIYQGFAKIYKLIEKAPELKSEENLSGINFALYDGGELIGRYTVFENMPIIQNIVHNGQTYQAIMRAQRHYLPFALRLEDFAAVYHPASGIASSYESIVRLQTGELEQRAVISMNRPLRYKNWTIYQSAFISNQEQETSILIAVRNSARLIPYISGLIIAAGLLLHLFLRLGGSRAGTSAKQAASRLNSSARKINASA